MVWNQHLELKGKHAEISPSKSSSWKDKSDPELIEFFNNIDAAALGTRLHAIAASDIELGLRRPKNHQTFNMYINDAIGFKMDPEVVLRYTNYIFGTTDAIRFDKKILRIHDLKTGKSKVHMDQLAFYAALFFIEYGKYYDVSPKDVSTVLRIYQNDDIIEENTPYDYIEFLIERLKHINDLRMSLMEEPSWIITE